MTDVLKYYQALELSPFATTQEIKQSYKNLAKIWHPDHNKDPQAMEKFQHISVAYDVLSDDDKRLYYDVFSIAYKNQTAPDMNMLKTYKDKSGKDNPSLRVLSVYKNGKLQKIIASKTQAQTEVLKALFNIKNYSINFFNKQNNLELLLHNSLAYKTDNNLKMASTYASQAMLFASKEEKQVITKWQSSLNTPPQNIKDWNYQSYNALKFAPLAIIAIIALGSSGTKFISAQDLFKKFEKKQDINYYQKVKFSSGRQTVDDMDISRIINFPVNVYDDTMLYHLTKDVAIKYAPSQEFDTLSQGKNGQTVRITGQTPDNNWYRIMIDDGQMGFVEKEVLKKGTKNPIPSSSKIK